MLRGDKYFVMFKSISVCQVVVISLFFFLFNYKGKFTHLFSISLNAMKCFTCFQQIMDDLEKCKHFLQTDLIMLNGLCCTYYHI